MRTLSSRRIQFCAGRGKLHALSRWHVQPYRRVSGLGCLIPSLLFCRAMSFLSSASFIPVFACTALHFTCNSLQRAWCCFLQSDFVFCVSGWLRLQRRHRNCAAGYEFGSHVCLESFDCLFAACRVLRSSQSVALLSGYYPYTEFNQSFAVECPPGLCTADGSCAAHRPNASINVLCEQAFSFFLRELYSLLNASSI